MAHLDQLHHAENHRLLIAITQDDIRKDYPNASENDVNQITIGKLAALALLCASDSPWVRSDYRHLMAGNLDRAAANEVPKP